MLQLNYTFFDLADKQTALDTINEFCKNYTNNDYRTEIFNDQVIIFVYDFSSAYDAMQLINAIDVILEPLRFGFTLNFIHYSESTKH